MEFIKRLLLNLMSGYLENDNWNREPRKLTLWRWNPRLLLVRIEAMDI